MLDVKVDIAAGIIILEPEGPLHQEDFLQLAGLVDASLEENAALHGILIHTKDFPGWDSFAAFVEHIRFIKDHHRRIEKIALATDSPVGQLAPVLARHFIQADIKHFAYRELDDATAWLTASG